MSILHKTNMINKMSIKLMVYKKNIKTNKKIKLKEQIFFSITKSALTKLK